MTVFIFISSLLAAMSLGMPIAFALMVCGAALMWQVGIFDAQVLAQNLVDGADSYPLMAVPFFLLAGELMNAGGLSRRIVEALLSLVGHVRGGLGYVAIIAALVLASLSGSAIADTAALAALLIPMMRNAGYNVPRSAGLLAAGGVIAPVVPPSIGLVLFGAVAGVSVSKLFIAGIVPGLTMALALMITWWLLCRQDASPVLARKSRSETVASVRQAGWALILPLIIIVGVKFGVFTPTEAGVVAVVAAALIGRFAYGELSGAKLYHGMVAAARTSAVVMFLVAAALISAWLITVANIPDQLISLLQPFIDRPVLLMVFMQVIVLVVGTALDFTPTILILAPVLMPLVKQAGIDPVYFGVIFVMNNAIGLLTPPVGNVLNVVCSVGKVPMDDVIRGVLPFLFAEFVVLILMSLFPVLVLGPLRWMH
ncbi:TRAP transporter large permease subunit [Xylophilus sp. GOD-11R]|uniref:TRAP transporter large permease n=1 Tax=Xylophilus sp. GOD-11R TaxID=3089814 RepID=UPI00298C31EF|nr:TRAP transporter large permease subunit [Xylophilus sp. GOD-11R]WPB58911.1 TRAP transporter large permease subunit [Xylophilus sp. GOD-11R]